MNSILVIEDDLILLTTISSILSVRGYEISTATNGKDALEKIENSTYDLVLKDLMLPYSDGLEVISELKKGGAKTPIIIISSTETEESFMDGFGIYADDYIRKPLARLSFC